MEGMTGMTGSMNGQTSIISVIVYILCVIAWWKIFNKAGQAGWKAIIPFLNLYVLYKITWNLKMFWIMLATGVIGVILAGMGTAMLMPIAAIIGSILTIVSFIFSIVMNFKLAAAFGHGIGFGIGLMFLGPIFLMILGFGSDQYKEQKMAA